MLKQESALTINKNKKSKENAQHQIEWNANGYYHSKIRSKIQLTIFDFTEIGEKTAIVQ